MKDYKEMIAKIIEATQFGMLKWENKGVDSDDLFTCQIGKCHVELTSYYDSMLDDTSYVLSLFNEDGQLFNTLRGSTGGGDNQYSSLANLYDDVRDYYYKITESEKDIMDSLNQMIPF